MENRDKKNILVVSTSFPRWSGDFEGLFIYNLLKRLVDSFNIIVLAPHYPGAKIKETRSGLSIYRFRYFWPIAWQRICYGSGILPNLIKNKLLILILPFLFISQFFKIIYLIKKENIDLIHAHWFLSSGLLAGLAAKIYQKPLIVTAHGSDILALGGRFWDKIKKIIINLAGLINVVSSDIAQELIKNQSVNPKKIFIIPMGVEMSLFTLQSNQKKNKLIDRLSQPILLFVGMLIKVKGVEYLIKALPAIIREFPGTNLLIIGSGHEDKKLKSLVSNLGLADKVFFLGSIPNSQLPYYYQQAALYILPTLTERVAVTILEAMSAGCPVITSQINGQSDFIEDGKTGLLVKPKSSEEISRAIIKILSDKHLRDNIIKEARRTVKEKYDWSVIANSFKLLYQKLI